MKKKDSRNRKQNLIPKEPQTKREKISRLLEFPQAVLTSECQMEFSGNREVVVEGCQGVLEYDDKTIRLMTGKMTVKFSGRGLQITTLTHDSAFVTGFITAVEFII